MPRPRADRERGGRPRRRRAPWHGGGRADNIIARLFLLVGPSGVGKNTLIARALPAVPHLTFVPSLTTRRRRAEERPGDPYVFVSEEEFAQALAEGDLLEWQEIHGRRYGTSRRVIERSLAAGHPAITDIDVLGSVRAKGALGDRAVTIFLRPGSLSVLEGRIRGRDPSVAGDEVARRLARARMEMELGYACDFTVVNDDLAVAVTDITRILTEQMAYSGVGSAEPAVDLDVRGVPWGHHLRMVAGAGESPERAVDRGVRCLWWEAYRDATSFAVPAYSVAWTGVGPDGSPIARVTVANGEDRVARRGDAGRAST